MSDAGDSVALSYNRFFGVVKVNMDKGVAIGTAIMARGRQSGNEFHLQLCFVPGEALETGGGREDRHRFRAGGAFLGGHRRLDPAPTAGR